MEINVSFIAYESQVKIENVLKQTVLGVMSNRVCVTFAASIYLVSADLSTNMFACRLTTALSRDASNQMLINMKPHKY